MPRDMQHFEGISADFQFIAFFQPARRHKGFGWREIVLFGDFGEVRQQEAVCFVRTQNFDFRIARRHFRHAADMVEMAVCQPNRLNVQTAFFRFFQQARNVAADIGKNRFVGFVVPHQCAVLAEQGNRNNFNM